MYMYSILLTIIVQYDTYVVTIFLYFYLVLAEKILGTSEKLKKIEQDKEFLCKMSREIQVKSEFCGMQEASKCTCTYKLKVMPDHACTFRCRDGKRTETRIGMDSICITHSCIPLCTGYV